MLRVLHDFEKLLVEACRALLLLLLECHPCFGLEVQVRLANVVLVHLEFQRRAADVAAVNFFAK